MSLPEKSNFFGCFNIAVCHNVFLSEGFQSTDCSAVSVAFHYRFYISYYHKWEVLKVAWHSKPLLTVGNASKSVQTSPTVSNLFVKIDLLRKAALCLLHLQHGFSLPPLMLLIRATSNMQYEWKQPVAIEGLLQVKSAPKRRSILYWLQRLKGTQTF